MIRVEGFWGGSAKPKNWTPKYDPCWPGILCGGGGVGQQQNGQWGLALGHRRASQVAAEVAARLEAEVAAVTERCRGAEEELRQLQVCREVGPEERRVFVDGIRCLCFSSLAISSCLLGNGFEIKFIALWNRFFLVSSFFWILATFWGFHLETFLELSSSKRGILLFFLSHTDWQKKQKRQKVWSPLSQLFSFLFLGVFFLRVLDCPWWVY